MDQKELTQREAELLDKIIAAIDVLIPRFEGKPKELTKKLRRKINKIRMESQISTAKISYEYNSKFLAELPWLAAELNSIEKIDGPIKNRFNVFVVYATMSSDLKRSA